MASLTVRETFWAARAGMVFVTFIFALASTIALCWMVRRHRDGSRWCFTFAKFLGGLYSVFCFVDFCCFIIWIAFSRLARASKARVYDNAEAIASLLQGRVELTAAARMCDCIVIIFLFVGLIAMGNGVILNRTGSPGKHSRLIKRSADAISVVIGAFAAANWGMRIRVYLEFYFVKYNIRLDGTEAMIDLLNIARRIDFVVTLITLSCSLAIMARAVKIYLPTRVDKNIHWPSYCLLLCSSLWLMRSLYEIIYQIRYINLIDVRETRDEEEYLSVVTVIFYIWPVMIIIWAFLWLGIRKDGGLWSTEQPWMLYNPDGTQDIPLEPRGVDPLPPAYSPTSTSASLSAHHQQPTEGWRESPVSSTSPFTQPQIALQPPPPVLGGLTAVQPSAPIAAPLPEYQPRTNSPDQPFVIEDRGPAPIALSQIPPQQLRITTGASDIRPPEGLERDPIVAEQAASAAPRDTSPASNIRQASSSLPEKSIPRPPEQGASASGSTETADDATPGRYQQAPADNGYNTGLVSPVSPIDTGPADGFYPRNPPPSHDETMGLNHQADGRAPSTPLPYPEKN